METVVEEEEDQEVVLEMVVEVEILEVEAEVDQEMVVEVEILEVVLEMVEEEDNLI